MDKLLKDLKDIETAKKYINTDTTKLRISEKERKIVNKKTKSKQEHLSNLFVQRDTQRNRLFNFCLTTIRNLLIIMFIILGLQIIYKWGTGNDLIPPAVYNTVFVSIIIQFIGVVFIIANKLWDEKGMKSCYDDIVNREDKE